MRAFEMRAGTALMRASYLRQASLLASLLLPLAGAVSALETVRILGPAEISRPVFLTAPVGDERLFVVERAGRIMIYQEGTLLATPFLDIRSSIAEGGVFGGEGGLLGLGFPPDYATRGFFYIYYTSPPVTSGALTSRISRFQVSSNPNLADPDSELNFFSFTQPFANHNGGTVAVRDGYLYFGVGDGGGRNDEDDLAQDNTNVFGQMVRWNLDGNVPGPLEAYAYGLRNPFRFSFDRLLGDLYIGDVGQDAREEIDIRAAGDDSFRNYGWNVMEGSVCKDPDPDEPPCFDASLTGPAWEYPHGGGNCSGSVTGGVVYRGRISAIQGHYFFADFCSHDIWSFQWNGDPVEASEVVDRTSELAPAPGGGELDSIVAFGEDGDGEMYIVDLDGEVYAVVPEPGLGSTAALVTLAWWVRRRRHLAARARPGRVRDSRDPARAGSCPGAVGGECQR